MQPVLSRVWSCDTLQHGVSLVDQMSLDLAACGEIAVEDMEAELAKLEAPSWYKLLFSNLKMISKLDVTFVDPLHSW